MFSRGRVENGRLFKRGFERLQCLSNRRGEGFGAWRRNHFMPDTHKQWIVEVGAETGKCGADGGLAEAQQITALGNVSGTHQRIEDTQEIEVKVSKICHVYI